MKYFAYKADGEQIDPGDGIVPILREISQDKYCVIGTGFYISRYGLFMTACHVLDDFITRKTQSANRGFIVHLECGNKSYLRRILSYSRCKEHDLAVGQSNNYKNKCPQNPLMNIIPRLSIDIQQRIQSW